MFDNLSDSQRVFRICAAKGNYGCSGSALREIRVALLEADVHFRVVKQFIENIKKKRWAKRF